MNRFMIFKVLLEFIKKEKMWFLLPLFIIVGVLTVVAILVTTSPILLPFIYAGF